MKKIMLLLLIMVLCCAGYQIYWLNTRYPSPKVQTGGLGDFVQAGSYQITFSDWQWSDGTLLQERCPEFCFLLDEDGNAYPVHHERVGLVTLTVMKTEEDQSVLDLTSFSFESGAWGNQFDMELLYLLNPQLEGLRLCLEQGESREIVFPLTTSNQQFTERDWERIDDRQFYMVLQYYPEKLRFRCR